MKRIFIIAALFILPVAIIFAQENVDAEKEAIKKVIQSAYVDGLQNNGDLELIAEGFHPGFQLIGISRGEGMWSLPIYNWVEDVKIGKKEGKYPRKEEEKVTVKFPMIDITGTAAIVKLEFYVGKKLTYIDYISLYKFGEDWKLVNKIFFKIPEEEKKSE
ncbi:MAG: nuclear transport factor 2 family protein [Bacteroidales bacterium]|nr:nuclear transport factor 2 family protein [Bacteroidales bacterium]